MLELWIYLLTQNYIDISVQNLTIGNNIYSMKQYATELKEGMMTQPLFNAVAYPNSALLHLDDCLPMVLVQVQPDVRQ